MYIYTIYFVPFSTNLFPNKKSRINFPSPFLQFLMDAHARRRRGRKSVVNLIKMDDYLLSARTSVKYHARVRQREEASGDRANLHMAETCGWKLSSTVISWVISFEGWSMYIYIYIYRAVYLLIRVQGGGQKRFAASSSLRFTRWIYREAGRLDPVFTNPPGINKMFWSSNVSSIPFFFLARERERTRRSICTFKRLSSLLFTFVSFIKSFHIRIRLVSSGRRGCFLLFLFSLRYSRMIHSGILDSK